MGPFTVPVPFDRRIGLFALVYGTAFTAMIVGIRDGMAVEEEEENRAAPPSDGPGIADDD